MSFSPIAFTRRAALLAVVLLAGIGAGGAAESQAGLGQAIATRVVNDPVLSTFYEQRNYAPLWMGGSTREKRRLRAFFDALEEAGDHGLPVARYDLPGLRALVAAADTPEARAQADTLLSERFAQYARDIQSGILAPRRASREIHRDAPRRGQAPTLAAFAKSSPSGFIDALPPQTEVYRALLEEKGRLERVLGAGGWGAQVPAGMLKAGQSAPAVAAMRQRLAAVGYGRGGSSAAFDAGLQKDLARFQRDHGLRPDGVFGPATRTALNTEPEERLQQVLVGLERERWMNLPRGQRHVWVNIPEYRTRLIDRGRVVFETRAVVGENRRTHRTPEFSDVMEFMVVNPTWNVPHSITTREYLPMLQQDASAVPHLQLLDRAGNRVSRGSVNFESYTAANFPYRLKEPPSEANALGIVKFMFPNRYNIYLHDTPAKSLFARDARAFSHGCIRLNEPVAFAHELLSAQTSNPEATFRAALTSGRETVLQLETPVRVHLVYRTVVPEGNEVRFLHDVYGRDREVFTALSRAGVSLRAAGG